MDHIESTDSSNAWVLYFVKQIPGLRMKQVLTRAAKQWRKRENLANSVRAVRIQPSLGRWTSRDWRADPTQFMALLRWGPRAPMCPNCGRKGATYLKRYRRWQCTCRKQFSVKVGTFMQGSNLPLYVWLNAIYLLVNSEIQPSVRCLARLLHISPTSAWRLRKTLLEMIRRTERARDAGMPQFCSDALWRATNRHISVEAGPDLSSSARSGEDYLRYKSFGRPEDSVVRYISLLHRVLSVKLPDAAARACINAPPSRVDLST